jgi:hypothetical protein
MEVIIYFIDLRVHTTGYFTGYPKKGRPVKTIVVEEHPQSNTLQHHEKQENKMATDEKKDIAHGLCWIWNLSLPQSP